jgi:hypothetical protein
VPALTRSRPPPVRLWRRSASPPSAARRRHGKIRPGQRSSDHQGSGRWQALGLAPDATSRNLCREAGRAGLGTPSWGETTPGSTSSRPSKKRAIRTGQVPDDTGEKRPGGAGDVDDAGEGLTKLLGDLAVDGEVVLAAQPVVPDPGRLRHCFGRAAAGVITPRLSAATSACQRQLVFRRRRHTTPLARRLCCRSPSVRRLCGVD